MTIATSTIAHHVKSRPGRVLDEQTVRDDIKALYRTRWFFSVEPVVSQTDGGVVLSYRVAERPILRRIEYRGNEKIKTKYLTALTNLKPGSPYDPNTNLEAAHRIEQHYREKGFAFAKVTLTKGGRTRRPRSSVRHQGGGQGPRRVDQVSRLRLRRRAAAQNEGPNRNDVVAAAVPRHLRPAVDRQRHPGAARVLPRPRVFRREGRAKDHLQRRQKPGVRRLLYHRGGPLPRDRRAVRGECDLQRGGVGERPRAESGRLLQPAVPDERTSTASKTSTARRAGSFPASSRCRSGRKRPASTVLVYQINEDKPYYVRNVNVHIRGDYPHSKLATVLNPMVVRPGDLADPKLIEKIEKADRRWRAVRRPGSGRRDDRHQAGRRANRWPTRTTSSAAKAPTPPARKRATRTRNLRVTRPRATPPRVTPPRCSGRRPPRSTATGSRPPPPPQTTGYPTAGYEQPAYPTRTAYAGTQVTVASAGTPGPRAYPPSNPFPVSGAGSPVQQVSAVGQPSGYVEAIDRPLRTPAGDDAGHRGPGRHFAHGGDNAVLADADRPRLQSAPTPTPRSPRSSARRSGRRRLRPSCRNRPVPARRPARRRP